MLNTRNEDKNTVFYSYLACIVNTFSLHMVRAHVIYRVNQAECGIHIRVVAPQEYMSIYSTRRVLTAVSLSWPCPCLPILPPPPIAIRQIYI